MGKRELAQSQACFLESTDATVDKTKNYDESHQSAGR